MHAPQSSWFMVSLASVTEQIGCQLRIATSALLHFQFPARLGNRLWVSELEVPFRNGGSRSICFVNPELGGCRCLHWSENSHPLLSRCNAGRRPMPPPPMSTRNLFLQHQPLPHTSLALRNFPAAVWQVLSSVPAGRCSWGKSYRLLAPCLQRQPAVNWVLASISQPAQGSRQSEERWREREGGRAAGRREGEEHRRKSTGGWESAREYENSLASGLRECGGEVVFLPRVEGPNGGGGVTM